MAENKTYLLCHSLSTGGLHWALLRLRCLLAGLLSGVSPEDSASKLKVVGRIQFPTAGGLRSCFLADWKLSHSLQLAASCFPSHGSPSSSSQWWCTGSFSCFSPCLLSASSLPLAGEHSLLSWAHVATLTHLDDLPFLRSTLPHNITRYDILSCSQALASGCGILGAVPRNPAHLTNCWCENRRNEPAQAGRVCPF